ncbi:MAG TPA: caspase family protein, partial [Bradyrhizobium sp.]|nr:caspase family protein [Bradyrhizobium sp.]
MTRGRKELAETSVGLPHRLRYALWLLLILACCGSEAVQAQAPAPVGKRVALVIGNASYPDASSPIPTALKDARALADELRRSDFDVDAKENL